MSAVPVLIDSSSVQCPLLFSIKRYRLKRTGRKGQIITRCALQRKNGSRATAFHFIHSLIFAPVLLLLSSLDLCVQLLTDVC